MRTYIHCTGRIVTPSATLSAAAHTAAHPSRNMQTRSPVGTTSYPKYSSPFATDLRSTGISLGFHFLGLEGADKGGHYNRDGGSQRAPAQSFAVQ